LWAAPPPGAFWRWSTDHEAIEWNHGGTLFLRQEVLAFVRHRLAAGEGLPPLMLLVFTMALVRDRAAAQALVPTVPLPAEDGLWQSVRGSARLRLHLLDAVSFAVRRNSTEFATGVLQALEHELPADHLRERDFRPLPIAVAAEMVVAGLRTLTVDRLEMWASAGVEQMPRVELPQPPVDGSSSLLLGELLHDAEHRGLVGVVRQLQAALRLPHTRLPGDDPPTDGFAGISNRGSLDRLLPSELVHDDDVLTVRIATNEALYRQRELPPHEPRSRRRVMLDDGLRMWGTPRLLGVAVALAIADAPVPVEIVRAVGRSLAPVDLGTRSGLLQQLQQLEFTLDARSAIASFLGAAAAAETTAVHDEPVLVVHRDSLVDADYLAALVAPGPRQRVHLAEVDEGGGFRWLEWTARGLEERAAAVLQLPEFRRRRLTEPPRFCELPVAPLRQPRLRSYGDGPVAIAVVDGELVLVRASGTRHAIEWVERDGGRLRLREALPRPVGGAADETAPFARFLSPSVITGEPLAVAELGERWLVYHDRRGFLHFAPRTEGGAELSLVLEFHGPLAGWCSEARAELSAEQVLARLTQIVEDRT
jgi:hypothetical protein